VAHKLYLTCALVGRGQTEQEHSESLIGVESSVVRADDLRDASGSAPIV
jgi:hypothetical protein